MEAAKAVRSSGQRLQCAPLPARNEKVLFSLVPDVLRVQRVHRAVRSATAQPINHFILDVAVLLRADPRTHPPTLYSFSQRAACLA